MLLAAAGVASVALAALGAVTPGLPTTVFLLAASYLFTRSCPVLEERLLRVSLFRPYLRFLDGGCPIPRAARWNALFWLWGGVTASLLLLAAKGGLGPWLASAIVAAALVGSAAVVAFRNPTLRRGDPGQLDRP
jgi:uncharacterized membrane protein YbaN (DUF454 family)